MYREGAAQEEEEKVQPVGATVQLHWFHLSGDCTRAHTRSFRGGFSPIDHECINWSSYSGHMCTDEKNNKNGMLKLSLIIDSKGTKFFVLNKNTLPDGINEVWSQPRKPKLRPLNIIAFFSWFVPMTAVVCQGCGPIRQGFIVLYFTQFG